MEGSYDNRTLGTDVKVSPNPTNPHRQEKESQVKETQNAPNNTAECGYESLCGGYLYLVIVCYCGRFCISFFLLSPILLYCIFLRSVLFLFATL